MGKKYFKQYFKQNKEGKKFCYFTENGNNGK